MDVGEFFELVKKAPIFVEEYQDRMDTLSAQVELKKLGEGSPILDTWIANNADWLLKHEDLYKRCLTIQNLSSSTLEEIKTIYEEIHGTNNEGPVSS